MSSSAPRKTITSRTPLQKKQQGESITIFVGQTRLIDNVVLQTTASNS